MSEIPRRARMDLYTPAERAIDDAMQAVEALPADVRLTDAVVLLHAARESVADYVDGIEARRFVTSEAATLAPRPVPCDCEGTMAGSHEPRCRVRVTEPTQPSMFVDLDPPLEVRSEFVVGEPSSVAYNSAALLSFLYAAMRRSPNGLATVGEHVAAAPRSQEQFIVALRPFLQHHDTCAADGIDTGLCNCGLRDVLARLPSMTVARSKRAARPAPQEGAPDAD